MSNILWKTFILNYLNSSSITGCLRPPCKEHDRVLRVKKEVRNHWQFISQLHTLNSALCLQSLELVSSILPALLFHYLLSSSLLFCLYHRAFEYAFLTAWNAPSCLFPKLIKFASSSISVQTSLLQVELSLLLDEVKLFPIERSHSNL